MFENLPYRNIRVFLYQEIFCCRPQIFQLQVLLSQMTLPLLYRAMYLATCELISPIWLRCFLNALRIRVLKNFTKQNISGSDANTITVSGTFTPQRIINETIIFSAAMKNSSGQWCANSVISNKSLVIRAIICPTLCSAKYECESVSRCANKSRRISVSILLP